MKHICLFFAAIIFVTFPTLSYSQNDAPVARVFGKDIFLADLTGSPDDQPSAESRAQQLAAIIWVPIMDAFAKTHAIEPTEEEIRSFAGAMMAYPPPGQDVAPPQLPPEMERKLYGTFVRNWKMSKALYEEYGGTVIFQQANPLEPVGAYRKLLEMHEAKGDFKIYDEQLKILFWAYYTQKHLEIPPEEVDYSQPWWLKKSPSAQ